MKVIGKFSSVPTRGNQILPVTTIAATDEQATADILANSMAISRRRAPLLISNNDADYGTEPKLEFY